MSISQKQFDKMIEGSHAKIRNSSPVQTSNMESTIWNDMERKEKTPRFDRQVSIKIRSYRHKLGDPFGISEKYVIDAIVDRGILSDDSCKEISEKESNHEQIKITKSKQEKTIITIESVD